jgi:hypothetical protein
VGAAPSGNLVGWTGQAGLDPYIKSGGLAQVERNQGKQAPSAERRAPRGGVRGQRSEGRGQREPRRSAEHRAPSAENGTRAYEGTRVRMYEKRAGSREADHGLLTTRPQTMDQGEPRGASRETRWVETVKRGTGEPEKRRGRERRAESRESRGKCRAPRRGETGNRGDGATRNGRTHYCPAEHNGNCCK